jgi:hypothetical protein
MEALCSPKLEPHGTESQKTSVIDTALKTSHKTMFFDHTWTEDV